MSDVCLQPIEHDQDASSGLPLICLLDRGHDGPHDWGGKPASTLPIKCPRCGSESWHPVDALEGYCGRCHWWTSHPILGRVAPPGD